MEPSVKIIPNALRNQMDTGRLKGQVIRTHGTSCLTPSFLIILTYILPHQVRILWAKKTKDKPITINNKGITIVIVNILLPYNHLDAFNVNYSRVNITNQSNFGIRMSQY